MYQPKEKIQVSNWSDRMDRYVYSSRKWAQFYWDLIMSSNMYINFVITLHHALLTNEKSFEMQHKHYRQMTTVSIRIPLSCACHNLGGNSQQCWNGGWETQALEVIVEHVCRPLSFLYGQSLENRWAQLFVQLEEAPSLKSDKRDVTNGLIPAVRPEYR